MLVTTASGSVYEFDENMSMFRRVPADDDHGLRKDNEWVKLLLPPTITLGSSIFMFTEPLGDGNATLRTTTEVTDIR